MIDGKLINPASRAPISTYSPTFTLFGPLCTPVGTARIQYAVPASRTINSHHPSRVDAHKIEAGWVLILVF
jgi:hypothetical protein